MHGLPRIWYLLSSVLCLLTCFPKTCFTLRRTLMIVGVPREIKADEYRVAMIPVGVEELTRAGHTVLVQSGAGQGSGILDDRYSGSGAEIIPDAQTIWKRA